MEYLDSMKREVGDECYFIASSYELPHVYIRIYGKIINKEAIKNELHYHIMPLKVLETKSNIIEFLHDKKYQTAKLDSGHGIKKRVQCFNEIMNDPQHFNQNLNEIMATNPFRINGIDTTSTREEINSLRDDVMGEYEKIFLNGLEDINKLKG